MRSVPAPFTRADWDRLPEGFPAQLIDGCLLKEPAPTYGHQRLTGELYVRLIAVVDRRRVVCAPIDVGIDDLTVVQPDVVVLRHVPPDSTRDVGIPLLAFEVLSRSTAHRDRTLKCARLLGAGTAEVWLVDPATRSIEVRDARGARRAEGDTVLTSHALPGFALAASMLFPPPDAPPDAPPHLR